ncbi:MAG: hypothetical protein ACLR9W_06180 [Enterobacter hormaechei]
MVRLSDLEKYREWPARAPTPPLRRGGRAQYPYSGTSATRDKP